MTTAIYTSGPDAAEHLVRCQNWLFRQGFHPAELFEHWFDLTERLKQGGIQAVIVATMKDCPGAHSIIGIVDYGVFFVAIEEEIDTSPLWMGGPAQGRLLAALNTVPPPVSYTEQMIQEKAELFRRGTDESVKKMLKDAAMRLHPPAGNLRPMKARELKVVKSLVEGIITDPPQDEAVQSVVGEVVIQLGVNSVQALDWVKTVLEGGAK